MKTLKNLWYSIYNLIVVKFNMEISDKLFEYKKRKFDSRLIANNLKILVRNNTPNNMTDIKQVMENVWNHRKGMSLSKTYKEKEFTELTDTVRLTADMLCNSRLLDVIGLQAMSGPVSATRILKYNGGNQLGTFTTAKATIEAHTRRLSYSRVVEDRPDDTIEQYNVFIAEIEYELLSDIIEISTPINIENINRDNVLDEILEVSYKIAHDIKRGTGNIAIVSKQIASWLFDDVKYSDTITYDGTVEGIRIYSVPLIYNMDLNLCIVGYKNFSNNTDAGFFYHPYLPILSCGVTMNPITFEPTVNYMTRYSKKINTYKSYFQQILVDK